MLTMCAPNNSVYTCGVYTRILGIVYTTFGRMKHEAQGRDSLGGKTSKASRFTTPIVI